jgi:hypothetical protein
MHIGSLIGISATRQHAGPYSMGSCGGHPMAQPGLSGPHYFPLKAATRLSPGLPQGDLVYGLFYAAFTQHLNTIHRITLRICSVSSSANDGQATEDGAWDYRVAC